MQTGAILVLQFVVAAAGSFVSRKLYSSAGCAQGDLQLEEMMTTASLLQEEGLKKGETMGECLNRTEEEPESFKVSCKAGFVAIDKYVGSDSCEEANLLADESYSWNCKKHDLEEWETQACNADGNGYEEYLDLVYQTSDCSGDLESSQVYLYQDGKCEPRAELTGGWIAGSVKVTKGYGGVIFESFPSMDCSGTAFLPAQSLIGHTACGECQAIDDTESFSLTCPPAPTSTTTTTGSRVDNASGTFQPSGSLLVLTLLAVKAMLA